METQKFFSSGWFRWIIIVLLGIIVLLLVFQAGAYVGYRKAGFSYRWADNYHRTFGGPPGGFMQDWSGREFTAGHGIAGTIAKVDGSTIVVNGGDNIEKLVHVSTSTAIELGRTAIQSSDLKPDQHVVVIGNPESDGSVSAKIIRVFDPNDIPPSDAPRPFMMMPWR